MEHLIALVIAVLAGFFGLQSAIGLIASLFVLGMIAFNVDGGKRFTLPFVIVILLVEGGIMSVAWYVFNQCQPYL